MYSNYEDENEQGFESRFMALVNLEVEKRVKEHSDELESLKEMNKLYQQKITDLRLSSKKLEQIGLFEALKSKINKENISELIKHLDLKSISISFDGMHNDEVPQWFKLIVKYYPDKDKIFALFDLFDIEYPQWAKSYKLPFDYGKDELNMIFSKLHKMYVCNGCIYDHNMGFHYTYISRHKGNLENLFEKESYVEIPWNLLLLNPLLIQDEYFKLIIDSIAKKESQSEYFFKIQDYQQISDKQAKELFNYLPKKKLFEVHRVFVKNNASLISTNSDLAEQFKDQMTDNQYGDFYYLNFPFKYQKEFILKSNFRTDSKIEMINKLNISKDEKLKLIIEMSSKLI
ncbi:hypothetical protein ACFVQB_14455 [Paenibacillus sp. NPDC057886]|uniref:hypothetical protein n=1 Tax=Paenibacillus sp. NPDC057886 TaxID=3346270 RepID=UPI0036A9EBEF